jgi:hypothetical protein
MEEGEMTMHTYLQSEPGLWTVGYFRRNRNGIDEWNALSDHDKEIDAMRRVNYLNGGNDNVTVYNVEP